MLIHQTGCRSLESPNDQSHFSLSSNWRNVMSSDQPGQSNVAKILLGVFLLAMLCGILTYVFWQSGALSTPHYSPPAPGEVAAAAHLQETRAAAALAIVPSLVSETGVITAPFTQPLAQATLYFDGAKLWVSYANQLIALDPKTREIVLGPMEFDRTVSPMMLDGKQLWTYQPYDFQKGEVFPAQLIPVDIASGQSGEALLVRADAWSPVYDGRRFWYVTTVPSG
jgi:hypothetical protein